MQKFCRLPINLSTFKYNLATLNVFLLFNACQLFENQ